MKEGKERIHQKERTCRLFLFRFRLLLFPRQIACQIRSLKSRSPRYTSQTTSPGKEITRKVRSTSFGTRRLDRHPRYAISHPVSSLSYSSFRPGVINLLKRKETNKTRIEAKDKRSSRRSNSSSGSNFLGRSECARKSTVFHRPSPPLGAAVRDCATIEPSHFLAYLLFRQKLPGSALTFSAARALAYVRARRPNAHTRETFSPPHSWVVLPYRVGFPSVRVVRRSTECGTASTCRVGG